MARIRVVTDSGADIPDELLRELDITMVPLTVHFGDEVYKDRVDLSPDAFYEKLRQKDILPRTSQPSPGEFKRTYEELLAGCDHVLSIHLSSVMSGTYQAAVMAASMCDEERITVIDTRQASLGIGWPAIIAARQARAGGDLDDIIRKVKYVADHTAVVFTVTSLKYLERNGRIGRAAALVGSVLKLNPVLTVDQGEVAPLAKVRGKNRALKHMVDLFAGQTKGRKIRVGVVHGGVAGEVGQLRDAVSDAVDCEELVISTIGATIGVHAGPGTLGLLGVPAD